MKGNISAAATTAAILIIGAAPICQAAPPTSDPRVLAISLADSPLAHAKTIRVREEVRRFNATGPGILVQKNAVLISRPGSIKIVCQWQPLPGHAPPPKQPDEYVADGKSQFDYSAQKNQYEAVSFWPDGSPQSGLYDLAQIDMIRNWGQPLFTRPGASHTITSDTLDGKPMLLVTDTPPPVTGSNGTDAVHYTIPIKTWVDPTTGLPIRCLQERIGADPAPVMIRQVDFSGWILDKPIPAKEIAWTPPVGSTLYVQPELLPIGSMAPEFSALTPDGKTVHLSDYQGHVVVLDFWATWCGPCQVSMPHLEAIYQQVKDKSVAVLALCVSDRKDAYDKWVAAKKGVYSFPTAYDPAGTAADGGIRLRYKVTGIPVQYVIDKNGRVAAVKVGSTAAGDKWLAGQLSALGVNMASPQKTASVR